MGRSCSDVSVVLKCVFMVVCSVPIIASVEPGKVEEYLDRPLSVISNNYTTENNSKITNSIGGLLDSSSGQVDHIAIVLQGSTRMLEEPSLPYFIEEPKDQYMVKSKPVQLSCSVRFATETLFKCNGWWLSTPATKTSDEEDPHTGISYTRVTIEITRSTFDSFFAPYSYWCQCVAWSGAGQVKSRRALVELAYLRRKFQHGPIGGKVVAGSEYKLSCTPPKGLPKPTIEWLKNGKVLTPSLDSNYLITQEGALIIRTRSIDDSGNYTCVAKNIIAKRRSHTAFVRVGVNGEWSLWSSWSGCGTRCGIGEKRRLRTCTEPEPLNGGSPCRGNSIQTSVCTKFCPVNGGWAEWSRWSACSPECLHRRRRTCTQPLPHNSGQVCPGADLETKNCSTGLCKADIGIHPNDNKHLILYGGIISVIGLLLLILAVCLTLKCKKRLSKSRQRRYSSGLSSSNYSSAPRSDHFQSGEFCVVPNKFPMLSDGSKYIPPPAYSITNNNYQYCAHMQRNAGNGQGSYNINDPKWLSPMDDHMSMFVEKKYLPSGVTATSRPTSREDQSIFYGEEYLFSEKQRLSQFFPNDKKKNTMYTEKYFSACPLHKTTLEKSEKHETSKEINRPPEYDSGFEGESKYTEEINQVVPLDNDDTDTPEDVCVAIGFSSTSGVHEKSLHTEKKGDMR